MSDPVNVQSATRRTDDGYFVEFGCVDNGVFHSFGAVRSGDYDEAQAAGVEAHAQQQSATPPEQPPAAEG